MARKPKKSRAQTEAEKRAADFAAVSLPADASQLPRQADLTVTRAGEGRGTQTVKEDSARRLDAFEALKAGMAAGCYDAARRLEMDILIRRGENDRGRPMGRVDRTAGPTTDAVIQAAQRIEAVEAQMPARDWWLLNELIAPPMDRGGWREHVTYITGERHTEGQAAAVRAATVNLRDAYVLIERRAAA